MEQARYWMWAKTKGDPSGVVPPQAAAGMASYGDSWEEQAFAEDAAGTLQGGCVWPPRSYSCTFCRREFKSAQALGGHMNVHRRDRARLKQSPTDHVPPQPRQAFDAVPTTTSSFLYNNPNPNPLVSSPPPPPPSWASFLSEKKPDDRKRGRAVDLESSRADCVTTELDVSKSLSLVLVCNLQQQTKGTSSSDDEVASCKRRRLIEQNEAKPSTCVAAQSNVEELDLELRLGINAPKVN